MDWVVHAGHHSGLASTPIAATPPRRTLAHSHSAGAIRNADGSTSPRTSNVPCPRSTPRSRARKSSGSPAAGSGTPRCPGFGALSGPEPRGLVKRGAQSEARLQTCGSPDGLRSPRHSHAEQCTPRDYVVHVPLSDSHRLGAAPSPREGALRKLRTFQASVSKSAASPGGRAVHEPAATGASPSIAQRPRRPSLPQYGGRMADSSESRLHTGGENAAAKATMVSSSLDAAAFCGKSVDATKHVDHVQGGLKRNASQPDCSAHCPERGTALQPLHHSPSKTPGTASPAFRPYSPEVLYQVHTPRAPCTLALQANVGDPTLQKRFSDMDVAEWQSFSRRVAAACDEHDAVNVNAPVQQPALVLPLTARQYAGPPASHKCVAQQPPVALWGAAPLGYVSSPATPRAPAPAFLGGAPPPSSTGRDGLCMAGPGRLGYSLGAVGAGSPGVPHRPATPTVKR